MGDSADTARAILAKARTKKVLRDRGQRDAPVARPRRPAPEPVNRDRAGDIDRPAANRSAAQAAASLRARQAQERAQAARKEGKRSLLDKVIDYPKDTFDAVAVMAGVKDPQQTVQRGTQKNLTKVAKLGYEVSSLKPWVDFATRPGLKTFGWAALAAPGAGAAMALPFPAKSILLKSGRSLERVKKSGPIVRGASDADYLTYTGNTNVMPGPMRRREIDSYNTKNAKIAYNLKDKDGERIGSLRLTVRPDEVYVDEVFIKPEKRGVGPLRDLVSQIPNWMEKGPDGEYVRKVRATLANDGIMRMIEAAGKRDEAFQRAIHPDLADSAGWHRTQRNNERAARRERLSSLRAEGTPRNPAEEEITATRVAYWQRQGYNEQQAQQQAMQDLAASRASASRAWEDTYTTPPVRRDDADDVDLVDPTDADDMAEQERTEWVATRAVAYMRRGDSPTVARNRAAGDWRHENPDPDLNDPALFDSPQGQTNWQRRADFLAERTQTYRDAGIDGERALDRARVDWRDRELAQRGSDIMRQGDVPQDAVPGRPLRANSGNHLLTPGMQAARDLPNGRIRVESTGGITHNLSQEEFRVTQDLMERQVYAPSARGLQQAINHARNGGPERVGYDLAPDAASSLRSSYQDAHHRAGPTATSAEDEYLPPSQRALRDAASQSRTGASGESSVQYVERRSAELVAEGYGPRTARQTAMREYIDGARARRQGSSPEELRRAADEMNVDIPGVNAPGERASRQRWALPQLPGIQADVVQGMGRYVVRVQQEGGRTLEMSRDTYMRLANRVLRGEYDSFSAAWRDLDA